MVTTYLLTSTISVPLYGKISDLYNQKNLFQAAIVIFMTNSMLSRLSQNILELILFHKIQKIRNNKLITITQTIIGDIIAPQKHRKYQSYLKTMFAFASVIS